MSDVFCKICGKAAQWCCFYCGEIFYCSDHLCHHFSPEDVAEAREESRRRRQSEQGLSKEHSGHVVSKEQIEKEAYNKAFWTIAALIAFFLISLWLWSHGSGGEMAP
jgi:hypothetical protein